MRLILENNAKEFISLDKELEIINRYLVIQKCVSKTDLNS